MEPRRLFTLTLDDGFKKSFVLAAKIHEEFGLKASLNIFTESCKAGYKPVDKYFSAPFGDWPLWNELSARGHEIMPHGYEHLNHASMPLDAACKQLDLCLDEFDRNMADFKREDAVFNYPYNAASPALDDYLSRRVRAARAGGNGVNPLPHAGLFKLSSTGFGPESCDEHLTRAVDAWLAAPQPYWLLYVAHGFDEEGWGPLTPDHVRRVFERVLHAPVPAEILPAGLALRKYGAPTSNSIANCKLQIAN